MSTLKQRYKQLIAQIRAAEECFGRQPGSVKLLAVSKTRSSAEISECMDLGQTRFGENQLQEALSKISDIEPKTPEWHFVGHVQSNKTARIAEKFAWVHSVDRLKLAHRLNDQRPPDMPPLSVCLQVNVSAETSKSGVSPTALQDLAREVATLPRLRLRGLMCIPAPCQDPAQQRIPFRQLRELLQALIQGGLVLDTLSMGMTDDMEAAIAEGATIVRIGTALFGPRRY